MPIKNTVLQNFLTTFGKPAAHLVRAPGRVNLIGEHTDYNNGFVLPMAIDRSLWIALRPRSDRKVRLRSLDFEDEAAFSLDAIEHGSGWSEYVKGIAWVLQEHGYTLTGWEGIMAGNVPIGAGLSSSAALELALLRAFLDAAGAAWDGAQAAQLAKQADNEFVGIQSGIMDQMISAMGQKGYALLLDCRSLVTRQVPIPDGTRVVILDTATRRGLVSSEYNKRVEQCHGAAAHFGVESLRDVPIDLFRDHENDLDPLLRRRARHVITENQRTLAAAEAMQNGEAARMGQLMQESHQSLRDDFEVSSHELNMMVDLANQHPGCFGARMTGAGFGGCAVALVDAAAAADFTETIQASYQAAAGLNANLYVCQPENGAEAVAI